MSNYNSDKLDILLKLVTRGWVSIPQAAMLVGVSDPTMRAIRQRGQIRGVKVGAHWRIYEDEMVRFLIEGNYVDDKTVERIHNLSKKDNP